MADVVELYLLGPVRVESNGASVRGFESRKALALLCYLAATRQPASRIRLADLFWEDKAERRGRGNLSRVLHNIAHLLPGIVNGQPDTVELECHRVWTDLAEFTELESAGDIPSLARAVALHRGQFLAGLDLDGCSEFAVWLEGQREFWRRRVAHALQRLVTYHTGRREHEAALSYAEQLLKLEPWCEEAHRHMMRALARSGQRSAAVAQYETCRRMLAGEFGVAPSRETGDLCRRIKSLSDRPTTNLPVETTAFVGRERELAEIAELMADPGCRLLTLVGPGGVGKTRLALRAAGAEVCEFLDGVYFVPLGDVTARDVLISSVAAAIGLSLVGQGDAQRRLTAYLAHREMLLVLDAFEHLVPEGVDLLLEILRRGAQLKLLVTSRQRLRVEGEWLYDVRGLTFPDEAAEARPAQDYSAVRLFLESARRVRHRLPLSRQDETFVTQVCRRLEGLPLGIELAAAWLPKHSLQEIAHNVQRDIRSLATDLRGMPTRHASLRTVLQDSWSLLSAEEREVLRSLSVFRGGFREDAARAVAGATAAHLGALVDKSFLRREAGARYWIHDMLRQDAEARLAASADEHCAARDRHCAYFCEFLEQIGRSLPGREQKRSLDRIGGELANIRAAWNWAVDRRVTAAIAKAAVTLFWFYELRGWYRDGARALKSAVDALRRPAWGGAAGSHDPDAVVGLLLSRYAWLLHRNEDFQEAMQTARESERLLRATGTEQELGFLFTTRGIMAWLAGDQGEARSLLREALELARRTGHVWGEIWASGMLGLILASHDAKNDAKNAEAHLRHAFRLNEAVGDPVLQALALNGLARVARGLGNHREAKRFFEQSLGICSECDHVFGAALTLSDLGAVAYDLNELPEAERYFEESLVMFEEMDERWGLARARTGLGRVAQRRGEPDLARRHYRESLPAAASVQAIPLILECFVGVAELLAEDSGPERARQLVDLVLAHPAAEPATREEAERMRGALRVQGIAAQCPSGNGGSEPSLEDLVQVLLVDLRSDGRPEAVVAVASEHA